MTPQELFDKMHFIPATQLPDDYRKAAYTVAQRHSGTAGVLDLNDFDVAFQRQGAFTLCLLQWDGGETTISGVAKRNCTIDKADNPQRGQVIALNQAVRNWLGEDA